MRRGEKNVRDMCNSKRREMRGEGQAFMIPREHPPYPQGGRHRILIYARFEEGR
jgi:hypothetical protein